MTMKILRKVSITPFAIDEAPRHTSGWTMVHLEAQQSSFIMMHGCRLLAILDLPVVQSTEFDSSRPWNMEDGWSIVGGEFESWHA